MRATGREKIWTRDFALMFGSTTLFWAAFYFFLPTLPLYMVQHLHSSPAQVGLFSGLTALTAIAARPLAGFALDRWGRRWVYLAAVLAFSGAAFAYLLAVSVTSLVIVRLLFGVPFGFATAASMTIAGDLAPPSRRGEAMGIFALAQTIATFLGPVAALAVLGQGEYARLFVAAGCLAAGSALLGWPVRYAAVRNARATLSLRAVFELRVLPFALTILFQGLSFGGVVTFLSLYARQIGVGNVGWFYMTYAAGQVVARALAGQAFDRQGPRRVVVGGLGLLAAGFAVLSLWRAVPGLLSAGVLFGLGWALTFPSLQTMALGQVPPPRRGAASATFFNGFDTGMFLGSYAMAFVAQAAGGYSGMYLVAAAILGIPAALFVTWALPLYHPWRAETEGGQ